MAVVVGELRKVAPFVLIDHWYANTALVLTLIASGFYFWTIATGVNRKDEVGAGAVALTVTMAWCVILLSVWSLYERWYGSFSHWPSALVKWLAVSGLATLPGGPVMIEHAIDGERQYLLPAACITGITMFVLAAWYICRYGRVSDREVRSPKTSKIAAGPLDWLGPPRRSPFAAIGWKQFRESGPLALVGIAVVLAVVAVIFVVEFPEMMNEDYGRLLEFFAVVSFMVGLAVAIIVGIGVFLYDVGPGLNTFWRSRPINANVWFWTKFLSGLAIILAAIYGPIVLLALPRVNFVALPSAVFGEGELLLFPAITVAVFAAAAAMTCLVRNAVYAAILSIAVVYSSFVATAFTVAGARFVRTGQRPESFGDVFIEVSTPQASAGMLLGALVCTLVAWLAVRNDWGQKSRY
jgi:hypothetical protein